MDEISNRTNVLEQERGTRRSWKTRVQAAVVALIAFAGVGAVVYWHRQSAPPAAAAAPPPAQVTVSEPLVRELDTQLGFLGQFAAVDQVELRAQVGGTLTEIHFKDGEIVHKDELLFSIDPRPYEIRLAEAVAQLQTATARLDFANQQLYRAQALKRTDFGTAENVDQRLSDQRSAQAAIAAANAQIRDAQFDLDHCRITAPFTGRIGTHLVSVGNLIAGSRAATSPTTLLATIVSLDPIYLNFDMSESDFLTFSRYRAQAKGNLDQKVEIALGDEKQFEREGVLDFLDNVLDRSSGTIHARATVPNPGLLLTPGEFARLQVVVAPPAITLLVPDDAVLPDQSQHIVLTVSPDSTVVPKVVELGDVRDGLRIIRSGLDRNDRVIIGGLVYAAPGSKVVAQGGEIHLAAADRN